MKSSQEWEVRGKGSQRRPRRSSQSSTSTFKQMIVENSLAESELFRGLPPRDLRQIAVFTMVKSLNKGAYLFREHDRSLGFYIVQKGSINLHRVSRGGKEQVIHFFRTGESLGVASLASAKVCPAHARAEESSQVLLVQRNEFMNLLQHRPDLTMRVLSTMCSHCRVMSQHIDDLTLQDVETRLCNWLIKRCPDISSHEPVDIRLTIPKRVLAAELGTVSETFSRILARFRKQQLLTVNGKTITINSPVQLSTFLEQHLEEVH